MRILRMIPLLLSVLIMLLMADVRAGGLLEPYDPYLDSTLMTVNMDRDDLKMPWDISSPDPFRLNTVKRLFDQPLNTMDEVKGQSDFLKGFYDQPDTLIRYIAHKMDAPYIPDDSLLKSPDITQHTKRWDRFRFRRAFPEHYEAVFRFLQASLAADLLLDKAFEDMSASTIAALKEEMPGYFASPGSNADQGSRAGESRDPRSARDRQREHRKRAQELFAKAEAFKPSYLYYATEIVFTAATELSEYMEENPLPDDRRFDLPTSLGNIHLGRKPGKNPFLLITDGKDIQLEFDNSSDEQPIQVIIAPGGNNVYRGDHRALGSGFFGIGILIDSGGNDVYQSQSYSQGSGFFGSGIIVDKGGNDYYSSQVSSQGSAAFGVGLIIDHGGNDVYKGGQYVQGTGWVGGYGAVVSLAGSDRFLTTSEFQDVLRYEDRFLSLAQGMGMGYRPYASGGIGLLVNGGGNNVYQCDIFGQGSAYWFSLGGLVDYSGHDEYLSHQYAQGSGVHMAFGALIDLGGNDHFKTHGVSQGCGHDYAFGGFYSAGGDDNVICGGLSQGAGNANGIGLFLNGGGENGYISKTGNSQGYSDFRRGFGMTGMFLNFGDTSWYGGYHGRQGSHWTSGTYGAGMDRRIQQTESRRQHGREQRADTNRIRDQIASDVEGLFLQASESRVTLQYLVDPAKDSLETKGLEAVKYMMKHINSDLPREVHAMRDLFRRFDELPTPFLKDSLQSDDRSVVASSLNFLIEMAKDSLARDAMESVLPFRKSENWRMRASVYRYLAYYRDPELSSYVLEGLEDEHFHVRRAAAEVIRRSADPAKSEVMAGLLEDPSQQVRYNAEHYFAEWGREGITYLSHHVLQNWALSDRARLHGIGAVERYVSEGNDLPEEVMQSLTDLMDGDWRFRARILKIAQLTEDAAWLEELNALLKGEAHPFVVRIMSDHP